MNIGKLAHRLRGSGRSLGANRFAAVCGKLQAQAEAADLSGTERILAEVQMEFQRVRLLLEEEEKIAA